MSTSLRLGSAGRTVCSCVPVSGHRWTGWLALALTLLLGCGRHAPPATVEGTLRLNGKPLDNCLVTFFPESGHPTEWALSTGLTDRQGSFRLRNRDQREGVAAGWHRVTVQDLSVSTGVHRRDHGAVDADTTEPKPPSPVRHSRVPAEYLSLAETPLRQELRRGHQVADLDIRWQRGSK